MRDLMLRLMQFQNEGDSYVVHERCWLFQAFRLFATLVFCTSEMRLLISERIQHTAKVCGLVVAEVEIIDPAIRPHHNVQSTSPPHCPCKSQHQRDQDPSLPVARRWTPRSSP